MGKLIKTIFFILVSFVSFLLSQEVVINKIEITGLNTATKEQIFRNSGLFPSEEFKDLNLNNQFDLDEPFTDYNNNTIYDYGTKIYKGDEFNLAISNLWRLKVFSDIQIYVTNSYDNFLDILIEVEELPVINEIEILGNKKIKDKALIEIIDLKKSRRISTDDIYKIKIN